MVYLYNNKRNSNFGCPRCLKKRAINDRFSVAERKEGTYGVKIGGACKSPGADPAQGEKFCSIVVISFEMTSQRSIKMVEFFFREIASQTQQGEITFFRRINGVLLVDDKVLHTVWHNIFESKSQEHHYSR